MKTADELVRFTAFAEKQGMDITSDNGKFIHPSTAQAWTKWHAEAEAFERALEDDDKAEEGVQPEAQ